MDTISFIPTRASAEALLSGKLHGFRLFATITFSADLGLLSLSKWGMPFRTRDESMPSVRDQVQPQGPRAAGKAFAIAR